MSDHLKAIKITESIYWVGAIDWNVRNFHGYKTNKGTTYNAYLILADKVTLVDCVKKGFKTEMLSRVSSVIDPQKIDYIISNHAEPDHSGTLPNVIREVNPEKVFASKMGVKALNMHYDLGDILEAVNDGATLDLGGKTVTFMETRMLHWPDSMFTYVNEDKLLFTQDAFGMHLASSERFDDELPWELLKRESSSYYANIIALYSPHVARLIKKIKDSGLDIAYIAPDHGPVWRNLENMVKIMNSYKRWSSREFEQKAVIVYDTMWRSTERMSRFIEDGLRDGGVTVKSMCMSACGRSEVADEMIDAAAIIVGSPTLNNNIFPTIADVLTYLKGLKFSTPYSAAFGSYGWSGESIGQVKNHLAEMNTELVSEVKAQYVPNKENREACYQLGLQVAEKIKKMNK